jgi:hypothetical protein
MSYPLVPPIPPIDVSHAPEVDTVRTGDPYLGGTLPSEARVAGLQPGFSMAGVPVMTITPALAAQLAGPQG